jgi:hypothetical protein
MLRLAVLGRFLDWRGCLGGPDVHGDLQRRELKKFIEE